MKRLTILLAVLLVLCGCGEGPAPAVTIVYVTATPLPLGVFAVGDEVVSAAPGGMHVPLWRTRDDCFQDVTTGSSLAPGDSAKVVGACYNSGQGDWFYEVEPPAGSGGWASRAVYASAKCYS